jgi:hypothetical protein
LLTSKQPALFDKSTVWCIFKKQPMILQPTHGNSFLTSYIEHQNPKREPILQDQVKHYPLID